MPIPNHLPQRSRKAVYSVAETAEMCGISRARFYDLMRAGVMPSPVYCIRTRRPMFTADLAALCLRVRETNIGMDGRYVIFYTRRPEPSAPTPAPASRVRAAQRQQVPEADPLVREMIEALRAMGVQLTEGELVVAITRQCPTGVRDETFEADLRAVFDRLRSRVPSEE